jgi:hypothetical protein
VPCPGFLPADGLHHPNPAEHDNEGLSYHSAFSFK